MSKHVRDILITSEVKALRKFGYPECSPENVTTDYLYASFFDSHLKEAQDKGGLTHDTDLAVSELRAEIKRNLEAQS